MFKRRREKKLVQLQTTYTVDDMATDAVCPNECGARTLVETTEYIVQDDRVKVVIPNVTVQKCTGECGGSWLAEQVTLELLWLAAGAFRENGRTQYTDSFEQKRLQLGALSSTSSLLLKVGADPASLNQAAHDRIGQRIARLSIGVQQWITMIPCTHPRTVEELTLPMNPILYERYPELATARDMGLPIDLLRAYLFWLDAHPWNERQAS